MDNIPISTHLHHRPYQLAITKDPTLPPRKWNHVGTFYDVSALSAVYRYYRQGGIPGHIHRDMEPSTVGLVFVHSNGDRIHVN